MEGLVDAGLVKNIGVSNFSLQLLYDVMTYARIKPAVNQIEMHPYLTQDEQVKFGKKVRAQNDFVVNAIPQQPSHGTQS